LHARVHARADGANRREIFTRAEGTVEIDDVDRTRTRTLERARAVERIAVITCLSRGIPVEQTHAASAA